MALYEYPYKLNGQNYEAPQYTAPNSPSIDLNAKDIVPYFDWTPIATTTQTAVKLYGTINILTPVVINSIMLFVDSTAITNGVAVCVEVQKGNVTFYVPASSSPSSPKSIGSITNLNMNTPYNCFMPTNSLINLFASCTTIGSNIQVLVGGYLNNGGL